MSSSTKRSRSSEEKSGEILEINLNVGGTLFTTSLSTLTRFPETMLGAMFSGRHELHKNAAGAYFIDRDGRHFHEILNFLRAPAAFDQNEMSKRTKIELAKELEYYGLTELVASALAARVAEAPVQPTPPVQMIDNSGGKVMVTRETNGVWMVTYTKSGTTVTRKEPIFNVCRSCLYGHYYLHENDYRRGIPNFGFGRELSELHPMVAQGFFSCVGTGENQKIDLKCKICK